MTFIVLYDANVLYPNTLRDLLIRIAQSGTVQAKWTTTILDEMTEALRRNRPDIPAEKLERLRVLMNKLSPIRCRPVPAPAHHCTAFGHRVVRVVAERRQSGLGISGQGPSPSLDRAVDFRTRYKCPRPAGEPAPGT